MSSQKKKGMSLGKLASFEATQPLEEEGVDSGGETLLVVDADGEVTEVPSPKKTTSKLFKTPPKTTGGKRQRPIGTSPFL
jgi:hypothetical protein